MEVKTVSELRNEMRKMFEAAHGYVEVARRPDQTRKAASLHRMNLCRNEARNRIAEIRSIEARQS